MLSRELKRKYFTYSTVKRIVSYQIAIKLIEFLVVLPLFRLSTAAVNSLAGDRAVTNATMRNYLLSPEGVVTVLLGLVVLSVFILLEVGGMIIVSSTIVDQQPALAVRTVLARAARSGQRAIGPGLVLLIPFVVVVLPLTGSVLNVSALSWLKIPRFITSVIESTPGYFWAYTAAMALFYLMAFFCVFVFHFIVLDHRKTSAAFAGSMSLVRKHFFTLVGTLLASATMILGVTLCLILIIAGLAWIATALTASVPGVQTYLQYVFLILFSGVLAVALAAVAPVQILVLTGFFRRYTTSVRNDSDLRQPVIASSQPGSGWALAAVVLIAVLSLAGALQAFAPQLTAAPRIEAVGHRGGGGDEAIENTSRAVALGTGRGAHFVEVDVQRTADGSYVIFHDDNLKRLGNRPESIQELSLGELKKVQLQSPNTSIPASPILTLDELIAQTRGKTKLFVELKGRSADERMVKDVTAKLAAAGMQNDVVLMSLDYDLIQSIKADYPGWKTGFVYFFSFGDAAQLDGDVLIVEEGALTRSKLEDMHRAGKDVAVWTVNTEDSMRKFVDLPVDYVITDNIEPWRLIEKDRQQETPFNVLVDRLIPGE